jgi:integrase
MRAAGDDAHGRRLRGLIVIMWRGGLRIQEALALTEGDLDQRRGSLLARRGKGGRRREVGMDAWGWEQLQPWTDMRRELSVGPLLCIINGATRGRHWSPAAARAELRSRRRLITRTSSKTTPTGIAVRSSRMTTSRAPISSGYPHERSWTRRSRATASRDGARAPWSSRVRPTREGLRRSVRESTRPGPRP